MSYPASRRDRICTLSACIMAVLLMLGVAVVLSGCSTERTREALEMYQDRVVLLEEELAQIEASADPASAEAAAEVRALIAEAKPMLATLEATLEGQEDWLGVVEGGLGAASAAGVPYAGLLAALLGWYRAGRQRNALVTNINRAKVPTASEGHIMLDPKVLRTANEASGLQAVVKKLGG